MRVRPLVPAGVLCAAFGSVLSLIAVLPAPADAAEAGFGAPAQWRADWCPGLAQASGAADFDGDLRDDAYCQYDSGISVALSSGQAFQAPSNWRAGWCGAKDGAVTVGDFNGDLRADSACRSGANVRVALSTGQAFGAPAIWRADWCPGLAQVSGAADFNSDWRDDLYCQYEKSISVVLSVGNAFAAPSPVRTDWCGAQRGVVDTADVDLDGRDDIVCRYGGNVLVALAPEGPRFVAAGGEIADNDEGGLDITGSAQSEVLVGGPERDFVYGGEGNDLLIGQGNDQSGRSSGGDILYGGPGDDVFDACGGRGRDFVFEADSSGHDVAYIDADDRDHIYGDVEVVIPCP